MKINKEKMKEQIKASQLEERCYKEVIICDAVENGRFANKEEALKVFDKMKIDGDLIENDVTKEVCLKREV